MTMFELSDKYSFRAWTPTQIMWASKHVGELQTYGFLPWPNQQVQDRKGTWK